MPGVITVGQTSIIAWQDGGTASGSGTQYALQTVGFVRAMGPFGYPHVALVKREVRFVGKGRRTRQVAGAWERAGYGWPCESIGNHAADEVWSAFFEANQADPAFTFWNGDEDADEA